MQNAYYDGFDCWDDVKSQFYMNEPEPDEVYAAVYESYGYDGNACVIYRNGDKYYFNSGSHCSCYGLTDQWDPIEYDTKEVFIECLKKMDQWGAIDIAVQKTLDQLS